MRGSDFILKVIRILRGTIENKIIFTLLSIGATCILAAVGPSYILRFILELLNYLFKTNFDTTIFNLSYIVFGVLLTVGILFCVGAILFYTMTKKNHIIGKLMKIRHSSIESSNFSNTDISPSRYLLEIVNIDQKLEMSSNTKEGIEKALYIQEKAVKKIIQFTDGNDINDVEYYGMAHIPIVVLLGYQIADKVPIKLHEWNQNISLWETVDSDNRNYPPLLLEKCTEKQLPNETKELVVKIGLTYPIPDENLDGLNLHHLNSYYIHLETPHRNNIVNIEQLQSYKKYFRDLLDEINQKYLKLEKIHLFYSGQPTFAYCIGSAITPRMDKEFVIYNYVGTEFPQYNWHINLKKIDQPISVSLTKEYVNGNV
ncbi:SAVED domain-containing protein [Sporosarcina sp. P7]|uniref:SAVED domain-containing protein n=1 Tax=Sporosarcina sp. P7 TaxID=2048244 RepID=UPI000C172476|nr:SAVED domain-containing protein [Sporosarcina sp. P7]PID23766.1 hypothetical protein CSV60_12815 [Sporosarcina sp. P7]